MKATNRSALILIAVVIAAIALAVVVVSRSGEPTATSLGVYGAEGGQTAYLAEDATADTTTSEEALIDPAKTEPILDKFHSKNPFEQLYSSAAGTAGTGAPPTAGSPAPSGSPTANIVGADIKINDKIYQNAQEGDKLPNSSSGPFQVLAITAAGVQFKLLGGYVIGEDTTTFTVNLNEPTEVNLSGPDGDKTYMVNVLRLIYSATGGTGGTGGTGTGTGGGTTVTQGQHSIKVLSIDTQNGVPSCTLVVDGVTYANKKVGDTFSTGWGQIKILGINVGAQTVTILHGDVRVTLQVGQSVAK
jgi:hypothetical protein